MKSIKKKNSNNKKNFFIIIGIIAALLVSSGITYALFVANESPSKIQNNPVEEQKTDAQKKSDTINSDKDGSSTPPTPTSDNVKINATTDTSGNIVVTTKLYNISDGECALTAGVKNGSSTNYTAQVIYQPEYSTCAGFTIPTNNKSGEWQISLTVTSNSVSASQEATVNVP